MKYVTEYRSSKLVRAVLDEIRRAVTRPWVLMEICGGQTHSIMRYGLDELLPRQVELVHGPGCPVCVTPLELIDKALAIAAAPGVIFTSYGDMLRVPGSEQDLFAERAAGGDVRVVYSPLDAVKIARENPDRQVISISLSYCDGVFRSAVLVPRPGTGGQPLCERAGPSGRSPRRSGRGDVAQRASSRDRVLRGAQDRGRGGTGQSALRRTGDRATGPRRGGARAGGARSVLSPDRTDPDEFRIGDAHRHLGQRRVAVAPGAPLSAQGVARGEYGLRPEGAARVRLRRDPRGLAGGRAAGRGRAR